jgi:NitT/TauT family transport system ATP-binding protein
MQGTAEISPSGASPAGDGGGGRIVASDVTMTYGEGARAVEALKPVSLETVPNDFVSIVGPSGCGKTTFLKILGDIVTPTGGEITIHGESPRTMRRARRIGYVFQTPVLLPWLSVYDNVMLPFKVAGEKDRKGDAEEARIHQRIVETLDIFGLGEFQDRLPRQLSGGMQSRVSLARALVRDPDVLLMDEPFAALDELTRAEMSLYLLGVWERVRTTVVFVTHHIEEAVLLSNRVCVMCPRPGRFERVVDVDLPRPRSAETRKLPEFHAIVDDLMTSFVKKDVSGKGPRR